MAQTSALSNAMAVLAEDQTATRSVRQAAKKLSWRLVQPPRVAVISPVVSLATEAMEALNTQSTYDEPVVTGHLMQNPEKSLPNGQNDGSWDFFLVVTDCDQAQSASTLLHDAAVDPNRCALWAPNSTKLGDSSRFAFISHASKTDDVVSWISHAAKTGQEADCATALFLAKKYKVAISDAQNDTKDPTSAVESRPDSRPDHSDTNGVLKWCVATIDSIAAVWPTTSTRLQNEDLWSAQDQITLLELEGTDHAAKTALCIILQLRHEIEKRSSEFRDVRLPNLKFMAAE
ncbi:MAG: hypothetical protein AAF826_12685 [Pseudomonadota bacterium]